MLVIDGSQGEGGGQILRTSLSMAMVTGSPFSLKNIRARRSKPGLMRSHLACVKAAQAICDAEVSGAKMGSSAITFRPNAIKAGSYEFAVGSAGSTLLIFQTVLPALAQLPQSSQVIFHGGTHNMLAPSFDFIQLAFAPLVRQMGMEIEMNLQRHGFNPQGGGQWSARIQQGTQRQALNLTACGDVVRREAVVTNANLPTHIAERELAMLRKKCEWPAESMRVQSVEALGGGNLLSLRLQYPQYCEVIEHVGRLGVRSEAVARSAIKDMRRYLASRAVVGEHLADQLLLPMVLGRGGEFTTLKPSLHCETNRTILKLFSNRDIRFEEISKDHWRIQVAGD